MISSSLFFTVNAEGRRPSLCGFSCEPKDLSGREAGAEAIVDIDDGDSGAAGVEHAEESGYAAEAGAVTNARGDGDNGLVDEARDHAGEGALHACGDDEDAGGAEEGGVGQEAVEAGDADIIEAIDGKTEATHGDRGLLGHGEV